MKNAAEGTIGRRRISEVAGKAGAISAAALLSLSLAAGAAQAGDHGRSAGDSRRGGGYESKIYGIIETMPQEEIGTWTVNGREVVVSRDTRIKEKHGRAEAGAYVEVEGTATGKTFTASETEVKRSKRTDRSGQRPSLHPLDKASRIRY